MTLFPYSLVIPCQLCSPQLAAIVNSSLNNNGPLAGKETPFLSLTLTEMWLPKGWFFFCLFVFKLCWVFVSVRGLSPVVASGGHSSLRCAGLSLSRSTGSTRAGSVVVAHGPSCSSACGIFPDRGSNPCPLHWQADSQPLRHQGSPKGWFSYINEQFKAKML